MQCATWTIPSPAPTPTVPAEDLLMTLEEVAELTRLSVPAIRRAIKRGELTAFKLGNRIRIRRRDLAAWMEGQRCTPQPAARSQRLTVHTTTARVARQPRRPAAAGTFRALVPEGRGQAA